MAIWLLRATPMMEADNAVVQFMPNGAKKYRVTVEGVDKNSRLIHLEKETE